MIVRKSRLTAIGGNPESHFDSRNRGATGRTPTKTRQPMVCGSCAISESAVATACSGTQISAAILTHSFLGGRRPTRSKRSFYKALPTHVLEQSSTPISKMSPPTDRIQKLKQHTFSNDFHLLEAYPRTLGFIRDCRSHIQHHGCLPDP